ncbi:MAG: hypothetical protein Q9180_008781, partial [Flavoplaca navasiana]
AENLFGEQHGCQPMKSRFPIKWPLGLDVLHKQWLANADKRLLAYQQPFLDQLGPNLEIKIMGSIGYTTYDPPNVEAVLSSRFDGMSFARVVGIYIAHTRYRLLSRH